MRQKKSNQLLININVGHALTGMTYFIDLFLNSNALTYFNYAGYVLGHMALVFLTIDRCILICWPFHYQRLPKVFHVFLMLSSPITSLSVLLHGLINFDSVPALQNSLAMKGAIYGILVDNILLLFSNSIVYWTVQKQKNAIQALCVSQNQEPNRKISKVRREVRSFYICIGCVLTSIILWSPILASSIYWLSTGKTASNTFLIVAKISLLMNPFCDAFILVWFNKELRMHLKRIFKKFNCLSEKKGNLSERGQHVTNTGISSLS